MDSNRLFDLALDIQALGFFASAICRIEDTIVDDRLANAGFYIEKKLDEIAKELLEDGEEHAED